MALTLDALRRRLLEQAEEDEGLNYQERDLNLGLTTSEADATLANQRDTADYNRSMYDLGQQRDLDIQHDDEGLADRGILRSGMNITSKQRLGEGYARNTEALSRRLSGSKEDRARQMQRLREETQRKLGDLNVRRARIKTDREQQKAIEDAETAATQAAAQAEAQQAQQEEAARLAALQPQYTPTGQYLPPDPSEGQGAIEYPAGWGDNNFDMNAWNAQNNTKPNGSDMPEWQRMGFPNYETWAAVYRRMGG